MINMDTMPVDKAAWVEAKVLVIFQVAFLTSLRSFLAEVLEDNHQEEEVHKGEAIFVTTCLFHCFKHILEKNRK